MANPTDKNPQSTQAPAMEDFSADIVTKQTPQTLSPSFKPAYKDEEFLLRDELRPVRLQLELLKPELLQQEAGVTSTIVVFGSTRIPDPMSAEKDLAQLESKLKRAPDDKLLAKEVEIAKRICDKSKYYEMSREFAHLVTSKCQTKEQCHSVIITGGGGGIMEAANRGASEAGGRSIGLNIVLPKEQHPNAYITPELSFQFQYFAIRKMHFLMRARALVVFPGGYGTLDELLETLTLIQTKKMSPVPVLLFGEEYWKRIINFEGLVDEGMIATEDYELFQYVESPAQAWDIIKDFHN
jgi:uncharacterized protein (TIGR00730 family)